MRPPALGSGSVRCWIMHEVDCNSYKGRENEAKTNNERLGFCWSWDGILQLPPLPILFNSLLSCFRFLTISGRSVQTLMYSVVNNGPHENAPLRLASCCRHRFNSSLIPLHPPVYFFHMSANGEIHDLRWEGLSCHFWLVKRTRMTSLQGFDDFLAFCEYGLYKVDY